MKTKLASLLVVLSLITTLCMAQKKITVEAQNSDISNNLDLKAVATAFGESSDLQEFEKKLNDYDSQISNLDLNKDGQVDYLRVIEKTENGIHVVEIQAVLDKDVYQDVASIVVEKDQNNNPTVQVIGDPYIYGNNYIIEPFYAYTPSIFSFFWGSNYYSWNSPYYWGYYPTYYHHCRPYEINDYYSNVYSHIDHNQRYYYTNNIRNASAARMISSVRRNDLGVRYPDRSFSNRNENVRNKRDFEFNRSAVNTQTRTSSQVNPTGTRSVRSNDNSGNRGQSYQGTSRTVNSNGNVRTSVNSSNSRTYTTPANVRNSDFNSGQNGNYQTRPTYSPNVQTRSSNSGTRDYNNNNYRTAPSVSQPSRVNEQSRQSQPNRMSEPRQQSQPIRSSEPRQQVQSNQNNSNSRQATAPRVESNSRSESNQGSRNSDSNRR